MKITEKMIDDMVRQARRCVDAAISAGGISEKSRMEGITVPEGWRLDCVLDYWLPPNIYIPAHTPPRK